MNASERYETVFPLIHPEKSDNKQWNIQNRSIFPKDSIDCKITISHKEIMQNQLNVKAFKIYDAVYYNYSPNFLSQNSRRALLRLSG